MQTRLKQQEKETQVWQQTPNSWKVSRRWSSANPSDGGCRQQRRQASGSRRRRRRRLRRRWLHLLLPRHTSVSYRRSSGASLRKFANNRGTRAERKMMTKRGRQMKKTTVFQRRNCACSRAPAAVCADGPGVCVCLYDYYTLIRLGIVKRRSKCWPQAKGTTQAAF